MKKNILIIFLTFNLFFLSACKSEPFQQEKKEFEAMLNTHFNSSMVKEQAIYLLIPSCQCKNCIFLDANKMDPVLRKKLHLIVSLDTINFRNFEQLLYDADDRIMKLSFLKYTNQIVFVDSGHIQNIVRLTDFNRQMDSISKNVF